MNAADKTRTLADKIAGVLSAAPESFDPEDEIVDGTSAVTNSSNVEPDENEEAILSKFRGNNIDLLADVDEKYAGKHTSRKKLAGSDEEDFDHDDSDSGEEESQNENDAQLDGESSEVESIEDGGSGESLAGDESGEMETDEEEASSGDDDGSFKHMSASNATGQQKKGSCVRNQLSLWENLLEIRIQLQKCLVTSNKMPPNQVFNEIKQQSGPEFSQKVAETKNTLSGVLDKMMLLQQLLLKQYPETKQLDKSKEIIGKNDDDDEEIPSDSDSEKDAEDEDKEVVVKDSQKRKLDEYESEISENHKKYSRYRNDVIQKWNDRTRVAVIKSNTASHSVLSQIEYNLSNKDKLVKRTQVKRSQYSIVGVVPKEGGEDAEVDAEHDPEIFDDDDFYHQLLQRLIEAKTADITDSVQLSRQWIQLQNMRSKMKRKIDTRATKGRKIRYTVHNKLVNFMAPIEDDLMTDEAKDELYGSLFMRN